MPMSNEVDITLKNKLQKIFIYIGLAFLFCLVFSDDTSPLARYWHGADSSLYMLFGKALKYGLVPYRDLFDHKGPTFFFLQAIGQYIWEGKNGIFILQVFSLFICLYFGDNIICIANERIKLLSRVLIQLPLLWILCGTLEGGDTNEEFALPFLFVSLYFFIVYIVKVNNENDATHNPLLAFLYGIFFGLIAFSRINNSAFLCAIVLTIVIIILKNKMYKNLLQNAILFIAGTVLAILPVYIFYFKLGLFAEMIDKYFVFAFKYSINIPLLQKIKDYIFNLNIFYIIPLFIPLAINKYRKINFYEMLFFIISIISTIVTTNLGYGFTHYYILVLPNIMFCIYMCVKYYDTFTVLLKKKTLIFICVITILAQAYRVAIDFGNSVVHVIDVNITYNKKGYYKYLTEKSMDIVNNIPKSDYDSIWGYGIGSKFYIRTNVFPCIKYYDFLDMYFEESLGDVKNELIHLLLDNKPKWIVIPTKEVTLPNNIYDFISTYYAVDYTNEEFVLYSLSLVNNK